MTGFGLSVAETGFEAAAEAVAGFEAAAEAVAGFDLSVAEESREPVKCKDCSGSGKKANIDNEFNVANIREKCNSTRNKH